MKEHPYSQIVVKIVFFDCIRSTREIPMRLKRQIKKPGETNFTRHLARHNGLEPVASRLGELRLRMADKDRWRLEKSKKPSNLGKNPVCVLCSFNSLNDNILKQSAVKMQSKCSQLQAANLRPIL